MMQIHSVPRAYKNYIMLQSDYTALINYLSQSVPFQGTSGKYAISSLIMYPRYKIRASFEQYNKVNPGNLRSIAKNESYATYVVFPAKQVLDILQAKDGRDRINTTLEGQPAVQFRWLPTPDLARLKAAIDHYNSAHAAKPLVDFEDFTANLDSLKERLSIGKTEFILNLLKSDDAGTIKLGMEMLANYDTERSIVALYYVLACLPSYNIRNNSYYTSTAFKSFRSRFQDCCGISVEGAMGTMLPRFCENVIEFLIERKSLTLLTSEYQELQKIMCEYYKDVSRNHSITLQITPENVILDIDPSKVIPDEQIEEEDKLRQEAALEDPSSSYFLLDDTV